MKAANAIGWGAVVLITLSPGFWALWGVNEAFHEGWCSPHLWMRLLQLVAYLSPATVLCALTVLGIRWPRVGATLFVLVGVIIVVLIIWDRAKLGVFITTTLTIVPALVGLLSLVGRPTPKRAAYAVSVGIPLLIVIGFGAEPVVRVNSRYDDGDRGAGNGVSLLWAPAGPGWTRDGLIGWDEAVRRASLDRRWDGPGRHNPGCLAAARPRRDRPVHDARRTERGRDMGCAKSAPNLRPPSR